jgi:hypothetical protein
MNKIFTIAAMATAIALMASSAMADPNIDMSRIVTNGTFTTNVSSTATAGAAIQGITAGEVSVAVSATNWAKGNGGFNVTSASDTDNAGPGVSGFGIGGLGVNMKTSTGGYGYARPTGVGSEISTAVVSFGTATVAFEGTFDVRLATDDWN